MPPDGDLELLAAVADDLASLRRVAESGGKSKQCPFATCYLLVRAHVFLR